jgi:hypothetical protein
MGKHYRFYHINAICASLGEPRSRALPVFHAFSGCDTTSAFKGKSKKSVCQAWQAYEDVTDTFVYLADHAFHRLDIDGDPFTKLERLTVILYDKTSPLSTVNETRRELFCQNNRAMEKLPPTKDALLQHIRRAVYQAGIWTTSTHTATGSFSTGFRLEQGFRVKGTGLDETSRSFKSMQGIDQMLLQRRLFQL